MRNLSYDPVYGIREDMVFEEDTDTVVVETKQDVTRIIELNKAKYNAVDSRARKGDAWHAASIPLVVWFDLKRRGIADDEKKLKQWLNDPANQAFRVRPGRV